MPDHCDICGVAALESQRFAGERVPFRKPKRYCPACHRRFYYRIFAGFALFYLVLSAFAMVLYPEPWLIAKAKAKLDVPQ